MTPESNAESWGSDFEAPKRKSKLPVIAWVLGSGCLFVLLLVVAVFFAFSRVVGRAADPEVQWSLLAEVLPFDERPADLQLIGGRWGGTRGWLLFSREKPRTFKVLVLHFTGPDAHSTREEYFGRAHVSPLVVQGRELQAVHAMGGESFGSDPEWYDVAVKELARGPSLRLDLSQPGSPELLLFQWSQGGSDPVQEQDVLHFLEPFQLERVR